MENVKEKEQQNEFGIYLNKKSIFKSKGLVVVYGIQIYFSRK